MVAAVDLYDARGNLLPFPVQKADTFVPAETTFSTPYSASTSYSREGHLAIKATAYDAFRSNWLVWAFTTVIAQVLVRDPLHFSDPQHPAVPLLETFFDDVNDDQSLQELIYPTAIDLVLTGEAFWLIKRDGGSTPQTKGAPKPAGGGFVGLERLINRITMTVPDKETGKPAYVEQKVGSRKTQRFNLQDVVIFRSADPDSLVNGIGPLEPLELILATEIEAAKSYKAYFANGMVGNKVWTMVNGDDRQAERARSILADVYTDPKNHHRPMMLFGDIRPVSDGGDLADMPHEKGREYNIDMAGAAFSVPRSKIFPDQHGGLGQAGKQIDDVTFRADTVAPLQALLAAAITRQFIRRECGIRGLKLEAPNKALVRYDLFDMAEKLTHFGGTGNEARTLVNLPPIDDPNMNKPLFLVRGVDLMQESLAPEDESPDVADTGTDGDEEQPDIVPAHRPPRGGPILPQTTPSPKAGARLVVGAGEASKAARRRDPRAESVHRRAEKGGVGRVSGGSDVRHELPL